MPTKKVLNKSIKKSVKPTAKKAVAKTAVKKTTRAVASKKAVTKTEVKTKVVKQEKKPLVYAENQKSFWVSNGQILNSLVALQNALAEMEKEVYLYHAGSAHNDFAAWVDAVLSDTACAKDLQKAKTPKSA
jgi:hypothetical protein